MHSVHPLIIKYKFNKGSQSCLTIRTSNKHQPDQVSHSAFTNLQILNHELMRAPCPILPLKYAHTHNSHTHHLRTHSLAPSSNVCPAKTIRNSCGLKFVLLAISCLTIATFHSGWTLMTTELPWKSFTFTSNDWSWAMLRPAAIFHSFMHAYLIMRKVR